MADRSGSGNDIDEKDVQGTSKIEANPAGIAP